MFDWALERDIDRLRKAARVTSNRAEQRTLEALAEQKEQTLARKRAAPAKLDRG
jgi:hypothetical protein